MTRLLLRRISRPRVTAWTHELPHPADRLQGASPMPGAARCLLTRCYCLHFINEKLGAESEFLNSRRQLHLQTFPKGVRKGHTLETHKRAHSEDGAGGTCKHGTRCGVAAPKTPQHAGEVTPQPPPRADLTLAQLAFQRQKPGKGLEITPPAREDLQCTQVSKTQGHFLRITAKSQY